MDAADVDIETISISTINSYDDESVLSGARWKILVPNVNRFRFVFTVSISNPMGWHVTGGREIMKSLVFSQYLWQFLFF